MAHSLTTATASRLLTITDEVHARLSPICAHMPTPDFDAMVARIAWVQLTFESDRFVCAHIFEDRVPRRGAQ